VDPQPLATTMAASASPSPSNFITAPQPVLSRPLCQPVRSFAKI
jgi:hypothetical protein